MTDSRSTAEPYRSRRRYSRRASWEACDASSALGTEETRVSILETVAMLSLRSVQETS